MQKIQRLVKNNSEFISKSKFKREKDFRRSKSRVSKYLKRFIISRDYFLVVPIFVGNHLCKTNTTRSGRSPLFQLN